MASAIEELTLNVTAETICDPWAGIGSMVATVREATRAKDAFAYTRANSEAVLGKALVPEATWEAKDPLSLLGSTTREFDVAASVLPMGASASHPLTVSTVTGESVELRRDLGDLILVAASMRLSAEGTGHFVVTPSFFNRVEDDGVRFVSYHFTDTPELKEGPSDAANQAIDSLERG